MGTEVTCKRYRLLALLNSYSPYSPKRIRNLYYRTESASTSFILNDTIDYKASSKLSSLMSSCHEIARLEENKKLQVILRLEILSHFRDSLLNLFVWLFQSECESMKNRMESLGERFNNLSLKYIQLKSKKKFQTEELK